jgi:hypothetical protein
MIKNNLDSSSNCFFKEIVSGGQTRVDRAALDVAMKQKISHGGWCPYERKAEDGIIPTSYNLIEASDPTSYSPTNKCLVYV